MGLPNFDLKKINKRLLFWGLDSLLLIIFFGGLYWLWLKLPAEGVKLHGTVDVGVDLLGGKNDLVWLAGLALVIYAGNNLLALFLRKREQVASLYLLISTGLIMVLLIGTVVFLASLNKI